MTRSYLRRAWRCRPLWFAAMLRRFGIPWRSRQRRYVFPVTDGIRIVGFDVLSFRHPRDDGDGD